MRALLQCVTVFALVAFKSGAPAASAEKGSPANEIAEFRIDGYGGMPKILVTFDGADYLFGASTGSPVTSFERALLPLLARSDQRATLLDANAAVRLPTYRSPEGRIGSAPLRGLTAVFCYESKINRIREQTLSGDLGMDALRDYIMRVDFDASVVAFLRAVPRDAGRRIKLDLRTGLPMVSANLGGVPLTFVLTTGYNCYGAGQVRKREFDDFIRRGDLTVVDELPVGTDFGVSLSHCAVARVPFTIGGFEHVGLVFSDFETKDERVQPNALGIGFLRRFIVTFDFPHSELYLAPGAQFRKIDASHDPGGVRLRRDRGSIVTTHVFPPSVNSVISPPALEAGVHVGDMLETVNGVAVSRLDEVGLARALSDTTQPTSLAFRRPSDGTAIHVRYDEREVRRRLLERYNAPNAQPKRAGGGKGAPVPRGTE